MFGAAGFTFTIKICEVHKGKRWIQETIMAKVLNYRLKSLCFPWYAIGRTAEVEIAITLALFYCKYAMFLEVHFQSGSCAWIDSANLLKRTLCKTL